MIKRIHVRCPHCRGELKVRPEHLGQVGVCRHCEKPFRAKEYLRLECPGCAAPLDIRKEYMGRVVTCVACNKAFIATEPDPGPEVESESASRFDPAAAVAGPGSRLEPESESASLFGAGNYTLDPLDAAYAGTGSRSDDGIGGVVPEATRDWLERAERAEDALARSGADLEAVRARLDESAHAVEALTLERDALRHAVEEARASVARLESEAAAQASERDALRHAVEDACSAVARLESEAAEHRDGLAAGFDLERGRLADEGRSWRERHEATARDLEAERARIEGLTAGHEAALARLEAEHREALEGVRGETDLERAAHLARAEEKAAEAEEARLALADADARAEAASADAEEARRALAEVASRADAATAEAEDSRRTLAEASAKLEAATAEAEEARRALAEASARLDEAGRKRAEIEAELAEARASTVPAAPDPAPAVVQVEDDGFDRHAEIVRLVNELDLVRDSEAEAIRRADALADELAELRRVQATATQSAAPEVDAFSHDLSQAREAEGLAARQVVELQDELRTIAADRQRESRAYNQILSTLEAENLALRKGLGAPTTGIAPGAELRFANERCNKLEAELEAARARIVALNRDLAISQFDQDDDPSPAAELDAANAAVQGLKARVDELERANRKYRSTLDQMGIRFS